MHLWCLELGALYFDTRPACHPDPDPHTHTDTDTHTHNTHNTPHTTHTFSHTLCHTPCCACAAASEGGRGRGRAAPRSAPYSARPAHHSRGPPAHEEKLGALALKVNTRMRMHRRSASGTTSATAVENTESTAEVWWRKKCRKYVWKP